LGDISLIHEILRLAARVSLSEIQEASLIFSEGGKNRPAGAAFLEVTLKRALQRKV